LQSANARDDTNNGISSSDEPNDNSGIHRIKNKLIGTMHNDLVDFFKTKEGRDTKIANILQSW